MAVLHLARPASDLCVLCRVSCELVLNLTFIKEMLCRGPSQNPDEAQHPHEVGELEAWRGRGLQRSSVWPVCPHRASGTLPQVKALAVEAGVRFLTLGFDPTSAPEDEPIMPKNRYDIMRAYMPTKGTLGLDMMLRSCTIQVRRKNGAHDLRLYLGVESRSPYKLSPPSSSSGCAFG